MPEQLLSDEIKPSSEMLIENSIDFQRWFNDPAAKEQFKEIIKDVPLSNLDKYDYFLIRNYADFMQQLKVMGIRNAKRYFEFQLVFLANASLGKGGFAHKEVNKSRIEQSIDRKDQISGGAWWGKLGKGGK